MQTNVIPDTIPNWIDGQECTAVSNEQFSKLSPHNGIEICKVTRSAAADVESAIANAKTAQPGWADLTPVQRGDILYDVARAMRDTQNDIAAVVAKETGMSPNAAPDSPEEPVGAKPDEFTDSTLRHW